MRFARLARGARALLCAVLAMMFAGSTAYAADSPSGGQADGQTRNISWQPCPEDPSFDCGDLRLPVDWSQPDGAGFDLVMARRPASDPARRIGTLFVNPGGPGGSGVDWTIFVAAGYFGQEVLDRFDIVGIDPRGVARSHPVVCSRGAMERPGGTILPESQAEFDALAVYNRQLAADCRRHTGPLYDHVDTISVARDIDAVRAALGEQQINWYGLSYGTLMGHMYAELFPGRIRSMLNDGNMDHSLATRPFYISEAKFAQDSFEEFVAWCNRSTNCALHGQDVKAVYAEVLAEADAGRLVDPADGHKVSNWELLDLTQFFFSRPRWVELGTVLESYHTGKATTGATAARDARAEAREQGSHTGNEIVELVEDYRPHFCEDWSVPLRSHDELDRLWRDGKAVAPDMRTSVIALSAITGCVGWLGPVHNPQHRLRVSGTPTILTMNGEHDPATGYSWALNVAAQLGDSTVLVTYEGAGHGAYRRSDCTHAVGDGYMISLTVPPAGTRCPANDPAIAGDPTYHDDARSRPVLSGKVFF